MAQLPDGLVSSGPDANCTLALCPVEASILSYQPSIPVSGFFIAAFGVTLIIHLVQGFRGRNWGFAATMACGCALEILGYVGRIFLHDNPFNFNNFLMQLSKHPDYVGLFLHWTNCGPSQHHGRSRLLLLVHICPPVTGVSAVYLLFLLSGG